MSGPPDQNVMRYIADLEQRLAAAEIVCTLYGWQGVRRDDIGKATLQAWMNWHRLYPVVDDPQSSKWKGLIADYAAERDRITAATLDRLAAAAAPRNEGAQT